MDVFVDNIECFQNELSDRLKEGIFTSEDNVRYCFVDFVKNKFKLSNKDIILEEKYKNLKQYSNIINPSSNLELDAHFILHKKPNNIFVEIKYNKDEDEPTSTENVGSIVNDLIRLSSIKEEGLKILVYVFESKMYKYLLNTFSKITPLQNGFVLNRELFEKMKSTTLKKASKNIIADINRISLDVKTIFSQQCAYANILIFKVINKYLSPKTGQKDECKYEN